SHRRRGCARRRPTRAGRRPPRTPTAAGPRTTRTRPGAAGSPPSLRSAPGRRGPRENTLADLSSEGAPLVSPGAAYAAHQRPAWRPDAAVIVPALAYVSTPL